LSKEYGRFLTAEQQQEIQAKNEHFAMVGESLITGNFISPEEWELITTGNLETFKITSQNRQKELKLEHETNLNAFNKLDERLYKLDTGSIGAEIFDASMGSTVDEIKENIMLDLYDLGNQLQHTSDQYEVWAGSSLPLGIAGLTKEDYTEGFTPSKFKTTIVSNVEDTKDTKDTKIAQKSKVYSSVDEALEDVSEPQIDIVGGMVKAKDGSKFRVKSIDEEKGIITSVSGKKYNAFDEDGNPSFEYIKGSNKKSMPDMKTVIFDGKPVHFFYNEENETYDEWSTKKGSKYAVDKDGNQVPI